ncbi:SDR family oxidoreductase [Rhodoblastus acidophilus]|uniref:SDR family oxidoreductase n=1 Tax=Candidatus Rhodoblastus alkanivorans TaxID=2954117 RepID=A0ABS9Z2J9_9HYPH|nr:SDR family oxidoreductase [Candidatus Rhodoblastus alkanivorans]MCI4677540.1 SDR family oxidoreductase [Candidatus Rhodoblastus alkanivorans]MCI4681899.1 SDR family oxidoreductase [Candidatus Rhodoblastus alkanivorans]MDI4642949.1 SDR family oxidoreductase [Rhodoblastus acidophilus]
MSARKVMLITGASGGIGADLARVGAVKGHDLALVARNRAALDALADEIAALPGQKNPRPLVFDLDLSQKDAAKSLAAALDEAGASPNILVNNAGYGALGPAAEGDLAEQLGMIDLNIRALTELSLIFAPKLSETKGRLLNVASIVSFMPGPGMAIYYASKAYVLSFTEALSVEFAPRGVSVTALCPGATPTGFQRRARFSDRMQKQVFVGALTSPEVARIGYDGMMAGKRVVIPGLLNKLMIRAMTFIPKPAILALVGSLQLRRADKEAS